MGFRKYLSKKEGKSDGRSFIEDQQSDKGIWKTESGQSSECNHK